MLKRLSFFLLLLSCLFIQCKSKLFADKKHKIAVVVSTLNNPWFVFGKGRVIMEGNDVAIIANGETVYPAVKAAEKLKAEGIAATVVSMHTIKPLDTELVLSLARTHKTMITVEEHSVHGGLGEAVASVLMQHKSPSLGGVWGGSFKIIGIPDEYTVTGPQQDIFSHYGISEKGIADVVLDLIK